MGALVFTWGVAVAHAGFKTMLLPFGFLLPLMFTSNPTSVFYDFKSIGWKRLIYITAGIISVLLSEMYLNDLREGDAIFVG